MEQGRLIDSLAGVENSQCVYQEVSPRVVENVEAKDQESLSTGVRQLETTEGGRSSGKQYSLKVSRLLYTLIYIRTTARHGRRLRSPEVQCR